MGSPTTKELTELFERYCDRCLRIAVKEYLKRAEFSELRRLQTHITEILEAPFTPPELEGFVDQCEAEQ